MLLYTCRAVLVLSKAGAQCAPYKKWWAMPALQMYKVELRACLKKGDKAILGTMTFQTGSEGLQGDSESCQVLIFAVCAITYYGGFQIGGF